MAIDDLDFSCPLDAHSRLFGIGWASVHCGEVARRGRRSWRSVRVPDLFGPVWVWRELT